MKCMKYMKVKVKGSLFPDLFFMPFMRFMVNPCSRPYRAGPVPC